MWARDETISTFKSCAQDPDGEIENSGKSIFEIPNFCYDSSYSFFTMKKCEKYKKCFQLQVKNYNLNVTEVRDSDLKNAFPGIFNFTIGILCRNQNYLDDMYKITVLDWLSLYIFAQGWTVFEFGHHRMRKIERIWQRLRRRPRSNWPQPRPRILVLAIQYSIPKKYYVIVG